MLNARHYRLELSTNLDAANFQKIAKLTNLQNFKMRYLIAGNCLQVLKLDKYCAELYTVPEIVRLTQIFEFSSVFS